MNIGSYNKALAQQVRKSLEFAFLKESDPNDEELFFCNDTDSVKYRTIAKNHLVVLMLFCPDLKKIWDYSHQHLVKTHYDNFKVAVKHVNHEDCLEVVVDQPCLTVLNETFKQKQHTGITSGKKKFDALFDFMSKKMASIKRHFFASPYQMVLHAIQENVAKKTNHHLANLSYRMKTGGSEKLWIYFQKTQFTVYFGINFDDRSEQQLCRIFLSELADSKKHVNNCPSIMISDNQMPSGLVQGFPEQKSAKYSFSNGITSLTIFGQNLHNTATMATYLANFRNYIYYHIQAQKCYLHSRILKRIGVFHRDLTHSKFLDEDRR